MSYENYPICIHSSESPRCSYFFEGHCGGHCEGDSPQAKKDEENWICALEIHDAIYVKPKSTKVNKKIKQGHSTKIDAWLK
jgi:hypothetical protein